ncbi:MAG: right-handed parallel beta-helix repeat-containing protein [Firmicutes bacterium]|nr:right-handed parallel beta-helix repeat-containing protein [Bacillota bacterium]
MKLSRVRTSFWGLASAAALLSFAVGPSLSAMAASVPSTLYVSTTGSNTTGNGSVSAPYQTIGYALSVARSGSTIVVEPGTYSEALTVTTSVRITADASLGGNATNTILNASGNNNGILIDGSAANNTVITGLTVENTNAQGVLVVNSDNVVLSHLIVTHTGLNPNPKINEDKAIELIGTQNALVYDNTVTDNGGGIGLADNGSINPGEPTPFGTAAPSEDNVILDNTISGNSSGCGIVVAAYNPGEGVINNVVMGNTVSLSPAGIVVAADVPGTVAEGNSVIDNTATDNFLPGIILHSNTPGDVVTNNSIVGNTVSQNKADSEVSTDNGPTGIIAIGAVEPVTHTLIADNQVSAETYGIFLDNAPGVLGLTDNTFSQVQVPISPSTTATEFPLVPETVNTYGHMGYFYAGLWPNASGMVAIAKYGTNGQLLQIYPARYSETLATSVGSVANGVYQPPGHYTIPMA